MHCVYILTSVQKGTYYVGITSKSLEQRLKRHNKGDYRYTKGHRPWRLIYQEPAKSRSAAVKRERFLKSGVGRRELKKLVESAATNNCPVV